MPDRADPGLRVLLVAAEAVGGIARHVRALVEGLPEQGIEVVLCAPHSTLAAIELTPAADAVASPVGSLAPARLFAARRTLRRLAGQADLVHAHGLRAGAAVAAAVPAVPLAVTWHNTPLLHGPGRLAQNALARYVARSADLTLAASEDLADLARRYGGIVVRNTFVAAPALDPPQRSREAVRAELGAGERAVVLALGRLHPQKRLDVLIAAAAAWQRRDAPLVVIAGTGPEHGALQRRIDATGAPVRLLGARGDVADLLAAADVVALPSAWEARALVAQEALRAGVPLVTTPVGGLPQLLGRAAVFVPVGDAVALRSGIEQVLGDPELRERLLALGRTQASTWPGEAAVAAQTRDQYLDLIERLRLD